jgi:hypothetical protein
MNFKDGKKYCRSCEIFLFHLGNFCPGRNQKEKPRINQLFRSLVRFPVY